MDREFVIVHGNQPHTDRQLPDYIDHIVYGPYTRLFVVPIGKSFVALVEYERPEDPRARTAATYTFERMSSFSFGSQYTADSSVAWREFGLQIAFYAQRGGLYREAVADPVATYWSAGH